jgi:hypothetical protein
MPMPCTAKVSFVCLVDAIALIVQGYDVPSSPETLTRRSRSRTHIFLRCLLKIPILSSGSSVESGSS